MKSTRQLPFCILFVLMQMLAFPVGAQLKPDTAATDLRTFRSEELTKFRNDEDFKYQLVAEPPASLWDRFWAWFWSGLDRILATPSGRLTSKIVVYSAAIFLIALFIFQMLRMNRSGLFGTARSAELNFSISEDDINAIDFDTELNGAISAGNYRLATRLYYLKTLKSLSDLSLINWEIDKTNISYVKELENSPLQDDFHVLTASFENHWYGNIAIDRDKFADLRERFETFNRKLLS